MTESVAKVVDKEWLIKRLLEMPEEIARAESDLLKLSKKLELAKEKLLDAEMILQEYFNFSVTGWQQRI